MIHHRNKMSQLRIEYCAACTFTVWCYARLPLQQVMYMLQFCFVFQYGESCPFQSTVEAIALKLRPMPYALYPCPSRNWLLFAKRQRGTFRLHVGCANTQWTSGIFSPEEPGLDEWHATTTQKQPLSVGLLDRKSVVKGKRVDPGGGRTIKKKKK